MIGFWMSKLSFSKQSVLNLIINNFNSFLFSLKSEAINFSTHEENLLKCETFPFSPRESFPFYIAQLLKNVAYTIKTENLEKELRISCFKA